MTAVLVVLTIIIAVVFDVLIVARRERRASAEVAERPGPMREPVIPQGIFLGPAHAWARLTSGGALRVGLDDFLTQAMGKADAVTPVPRGTEVARGDTVVAIRIGSRTLAVPSPVEGRVVEVNDRVSAQPWLVGRDPYGAGWCVGIWSRDLKEALRPLRVGAGAAAFLREELGRLIDFLLGRAVPTTAPVLADGGTPFVGALRELDDNGWQAFEDEFCRNTATE